MEDLLTIEVDEYGIAEEDLYNSTVDYLLDELF